MGKDNASAYKTRLGIWMFLTYTIVYAGFIVINSTMPSLMQEVIFGQTLAIVYGFGLLLLALAQAVIYNLLCNRAEARLNN